jgi:polysaccharide biosynthesis transport protein
MALNIKTIDDCIGLVKRRKYFIVIPWVFLSLIAVIVAYNIPKAYRSTATMLFEAPLPTNLFESTVSQFADEQIQSIYQRVTATENALLLIKTNGLYDDIKENLTDHELVSIFRDATEVNLSTSSLPPKASSGMAEVAFDLSFNNDDAVKAKEVASQLASLFIEQNDKARTQRATKATAFLMEESEKLSRNLQEIDNRIALFKEQNNFSLPEQVQGNLAALDRTENELRDTYSQIRTTKERIAFLSAELARAQEGAFVGLDDKTPQNKEDTLSAMKAQYFKLSGVYSPSHPSLLRLKREIKSLDPKFEGQSEGQPAEDELLEQLKIAKDELNLLKQTYTGDHPDLAKRQLQIEALERQLTTASRNSITDKPNNARTSNPAYIGVEAQYKASQSEHQALLQKQDYLKDKLDKMHNLVTLAPQVEKGYNDLLRERDNTVKKYTQLKEKLLDAKLFQTQEEQQKGQTLTIIEKPVIPRHPEKAIRRKIAIGGFFAGIFAGLGLALLLEFMDPSVRGHRAVRQITGLMPLIIIPYIENNLELEEKLSKQRKDKKILAWVMLAGIILFIVVVYAFFLPVEKH